jgi:hypothetical protein
MVTNDLIRVLSLYGKNISPSVVDEVVGYLEYLGGFIPESLDTKDKLDSDFEDFLCK